MGKLENLKPFTSEQNREEAAKNGKKGGIASGEARRKRKTIKELFEIIASMQDKNTGETNDYAMCLAMFEKAKQGDTQAFKEIRDSLGEKPKDSLEVTTKPLEVKVFKKE